MMQSSASELGELEGRKSTPSGHSRTAALGHFVDNERSNLGGNPPQFGYHIAEPIIYKPKLRVILKSQFDDR
jgi:hypothetical protein